MQSDLIVAIFSGLGGMLGWGLADFFAKKTIDKIGDLTTLFWSQLIGIFPILVLLSFKPSIPNFSYFDWLCIVLLGIGEGISYIPVYTAYQKGKVSLLSPIFASYGVFVAIISAIFFNERIPLGALISSLLVFVGILLINGGIKEIFRMKSGELNIKGLPEILLASLLFSFWIIAFNFFVSNRDWLLILLFIQFFSAASVFLYAKIMKQNIFVADKSLWKYLVLIGSAGVMADYFIAYGLSLSSHTAIIAILSSAFSLPVIILGYFFLREKISKIQIVGCGIILLGIVFLYLKL